VNFSNFTREIWHIFKTTMKPRTYPVNYVGPYLFL